MTMVDDLDTASIPALPIGRGTKSLTTFPLGRVCESPDCRVILSRYNPAPWCSVHEGAERMRQRYRATDWLPSAAHLRAVGEQCYEHPLFRCDGCEYVYPIRFQWKLSHKRWCRWCKPVGAVRSDEPDLELR